ncbi:MAG TPA: ATP-binding cassette domain-containing protein, partial [Nitrosopumilaceae archaeon]|nr:ATP-binding cassette domain-containing protein [Nitrosopumilaceae archaeon]
SSLLKLITRLYDPSQGQILVDGQDVKQVKVESLRNEIAVVPQMPVIFTGTILENIRMAKPDATNKDVEEASKSADASEFIGELQKGFNTVLGAGGTNLSGGQIQRIAIARALLRKPKILLLDEPSSALDPKSEAAIMSTLDHLKDTITIILVGHHLKAISRVDRLVVIDGGEVVQDGTHNELISSPGVYSILYSGGETTNE